MSPSSIPRGRRSFIKLGLVAVSAAAVPLLQACAAPAQPTAAPKPTEAPKAAAPAPTSVPAPAQPTSAPAAPSPTQAPRASEPTKPAAATAVAKPAAAKPGTKIQVCTRGGTDGEIMDKSVKDFAAETGIVAEHVAYGPEPEYWAKVQALYSTKQVADVIWASVGNFHNFANRGLLAELEPLAKADNYDLSDYVPAGLKTMSWKGKLYGLPWGGHPGNGGMHYNVDLLVAAGYKVTEDPESLNDWTYDVLLEAARKLTKQEGGRTAVFGYGPGTDYLSITNIVGAYGGRLMNEEGTKIQVDTEPVVKGLTWLRDVFVTHKVGPVPAPDLNRDELFSNQRLALNHTGYWGQFTPGEKVIAGKFKWNVALQPKGPSGKRGTALTINGQTMSSISDKKEAAWLFLKWLMEPKNHIAIVLSGGSRPALRNSVLDHPDLMQKMKAHKVFAKAIKEAEPWQLPANLRWPEVNSTLTQVFAGVWAGTQTLEQALPDAKKKLQDVLDKPMI